MICRIGEESIEASNASIGSVAGFIEMMEERDFSNEELYEHPLMESEMSFQVTLMQEVDKPRDPQQIFAIRELASQEGVSNLGIALE